MSQSLESGLDHVCAAGKARDTPGCVGHCVGPWKDCACGDNMGSWNMSYSGARSASHP